MNSFFGALFLILLVLKLCKVIAVSWLVVCSPLIVAAAIVVIVLACAVLFNALRN
jgi:hypothetical protein